MTLRVCKICSKEATNKDELEEFVKNKGAKYGRKQICKQCEAHKQKTRNLDNKMEALYYKGGECLHCGIEANRSNSIIFDFHHLGDKDFNIAEVRHSFIKMKKELDKCILLCSNCHRLEHKDD